MQKRCYEVKWNQTNARPSILLQNKTRLSVVYGTHLKEYQGSKQRRLLYLPTCDSPATSESETVKRN